MNSMYKQVKIFVDPLMFPWAQSFYLQGIVDVVGKRNVKFDAHYFEEIPNNASRPYSFNFVVVEQGKVTKYAIDWFDTNAINNKSAYEWCDVYAKVNTNWTITPKQEFPKIQPVPPSMGIRFHSLFGCIVDLLSNSCKSGIVLSNDFLKYARYYYREFKRLPLDSYCYKPELVENGYVFFLSTLWYNAEWNNNDELLNTPRYNMMDWISEQKFVSFEGGFVPHGKRSQRRGYESSNQKYLKYLTRGGVEVSEYMEKMQKSYIAVNTGGVVSCFGWKLAEYLALGKAIVSLPISNYLEVPLEHGKNIHFVENDRESISEALTYIYEHSDYRKSLEYGSRQYWETYCRPDKVISNLLKNM